MDKKEDKAELDAAFIISQASKRDRVIKPYKPKHGDSDDAITEEPQPAPSSKEDNRRRKSKGQDYESLFIKDAPGSTRGGKTVYIRKEFHDRIIRIIQVIGSNELSLFSYLDNVLEHHFDTFQDVISELYEQRNPDIF